MPKFALLVGGEVFEGDFACYLLEVLFEGVSSLAGFIELAGLVVEASLAGDVGVLEVFGPAAELARAVFGEVFEFGELPVQMSGRVQALDEAEHRAGFAGGAAGDVEEINEFGFGVQCGSPARSVLWSFASKRAACASSAAAMWSG